MLSQTVGYAITALGILGRSERACFVRELAEQAQIPAAYLAKLVNTMARKGLLTTQRGLSGGVSLARPAREISLLDVCQAFDDPILNRPCLLGNATCSEERSCPAHRFWTAERERLIEMLRRVTVLDIAEFQGRSRRRR